jgi:YegS/Rv2252/BmrU family lipid kinase
MNILIVANPIAGGGRARGRVDALAAVLTSRGHSVSPYFTRFAGDGKQQLLRLDPGFDRVVVVGGDGTFNEAVNGLPEGCDTPLLHLPTGNANLLATDLGLPRDAAGAADLLERGRVIRADVAVMNGTRFIMVAGAGFDARVTEELKRVRRGNVSNLSYVLPVLRALRGRSGPPLAVSVDGQPPAAGAAVLVCNVRTYGGICEIAFAADVANGRLDIVVLPEEGLWPLVKVFAAARFSRVTRVRGVRYLTGKRVAISASAPVAMQLDGDFVGRFRQVDIALYPASVPIVVPPLRGAKR